jgi:hypothetical protein
MLHYLRQNIDVPPTLFPPSSDLISSGEGHFDPKATTGNGNGFVSCVRTRAIVHRRASRRWALCHE